jgi:putative flippase GtrA
VRLVESVFDVTPAALIDAIVTERGVIEAPDSAKMQAMFGTGRVTIVCRLPSAAGARRVRERRQFILFCVGGVIGFIVDAGVLQLLVSGLAWDRFTGRLISFLLRGHGDMVVQSPLYVPWSAPAPLHWEWARYVMAMSAGFACNFAAYSALVLWYDIDPAVAGAGRGGRFGRRIGVNFLASRYWVIASRIDCVSPIQSYNCAASVKPATSSSPPPP